MSDSEEGGKEPNPTRDTFFGRWEDGELKPVPPEDVTLSSSSETKKEKTQLSKSRKVSPTPRHPVRFFSKRKLEEPPTESESQK